MGLRESFSRYLNPSPLGEGSSELTKNRNGLFRQKIFNFIHYRGCCRCSRFIFSKHPRKPYAQS